MIFMVEMKVDVLMSVGDVWKHSTRFEAVLRDSKIFSFLCKLTTKLTFCWMLPLLHFFPMFPCCK